MTATIHHVISPDGTTIGYRKMGSGPGLIIGHGAGRISQNYSKLAQALADTFSVYIPDRRGRGLSGPEGDNYSIEQAVADLSAVINATGAQYIFGHSTGGLITLETMLSNPVKKIVVYEPPVSVDHSFPLQWLPVFERLIKQGRMKKAMAISLKGLRAHEGVAKMPLWAIQMLIHLISFAERKKEKGTRMLDLLPTLIADVKMVARLDSTFERYKQINMPVFLQAGSQSPDYFHKAIETLQTILPISTIKIFEGFDHYSPEEKVQEIAESIKQFIEL